MSGGTVAALIVFWISLAVCTYIYFGYPALLLVMSKLRPRPVRSGDVTPRATFVIPAYNEERNIGAKIENTLSLDYPADALEVLVVSNGSTDGTNDIVRKWNDQRVRLLALERPGKMEALNEGARAATGDILVFTDADFLLDSHSLRLMASKFADPEVGGVCGARNTSRQRGGDSTGEGEGLYHRWDKWQKVRESQIGSVFAADGLLYAIRRELYVPITDPNQSDDQAISMRVVLQGYRLLFEPNATAWENAPVVAGSEFKRKVRITQHSVASLLKLGAPLFTSGWYSLELLSHKLVRHMIAFFLITTFLTNLFITHVSPLYKLTLLGQIAIYALAMIGAVLRNSTIGRAKPFYIPYYFCFVNTTAFIGLLTMMRSRPAESWTSREAA
jgi:cellulose synthase/poly-beta-1,6-N-acetylglucosamine synthase-like glycosyltransferase